MLHSTICNTKHTQGLQLQMSKNPVCRWYNLMSFFHIFKFKTIAYLEQRPTWSSTLSIEKLIHTVLKTRNNISVNIILKTIQQRLFWKKIKCSFCISLLSWIYYPSLCIDRVRLNNELIEATCTSTKIIREICKLPLGMKYMYTMPKKNDLGFQAHPHLLRGCRIAPFYWQFHKIKK